MPLLDVVLLKKQLRLDADDTAEDELLGIYLEAAEQAAANYIGRQLYPAGEAVPEGDSYGLTLDNKAVVAAILMHAAQMYENRETVVTGITVSEVPMIGTPSWLTIGPIANISLLSVGPRIASTLSLWINLLAALIASFFSPLESSNTSSIFTFPLALISSRASSSPWRIDSP